MNDELPTDSAQQDALFSYADSAGSYLLADARSLSHIPYFVVTHNGNSVALQYQGRREETQQSTGRQTILNFWNDAGCLFSIESRTLIPDRTYLVVSKQLLSTYTLLRLLRRDYSPLDSASSTRVAHARGQAVQRSWRVASVDSLGEVAVVLFADTTNPLACLVFLNNSLVVCEDYRGDTTDRQSTWRVDDGGIFDGTTIGIIAAFHSSKGILLARTWAGAEGENNALLIQSSNRFVPIMKSYRYWVMN
jgi:hypothetical protein